MDTSILLLAAAGLLMVIAVILLCSGSGSGGERAEKAEKTGKKRRQKKSKASFDPEYAVLFNKTYLNAGSIPDTLHILLDQYTENRFMRGRIQNAIAYLEGDYGDYETAINMITQGVDAAAEKAHEEAIHSEIAKRTGLPGY